MNDFSHKKMTGENNEMIQALMLFLNTDYVFNEYDVGRFTNDTSLFLPLRL